MNIPSFENKIRGEYRARLYGSAGELKYDSGWRPNMILNQGPFRMLTTNNALTRMALGDSADAVDPAQTGIQGSYLGGISYSNGFASANWSTPPYWAYSQCPWVFAPGVATGTIREFALCESADVTSATTEGVIRVVLDTPIVKGASDQLTIEHRLYMYMDTAVQSGVLDASGVSYDWEMGWYNIDSIIGGAIRPFSLITAFCNGPKTSGSIPVNTNLINGVMPVDIFSLPVGDDTGLNWRAVSFIVTAGSPPYITVTLSSNVDQMNTTFNMTKIRQGIDSGSNPDAGRVIKLARTSDGEPFTKENTHEITLRYRLYLDIYTP
jgi:hypothetical protein